MEQSQQEYLKQEQSGCGEEKPEQ